jgi:hypothetical protein
MDQDRLTVLYSMYTFVFLGCFGDVQCSCLRIEVCHPPRRTRSHWRRNGIGYARARYLFHFFFSILFNCLFLKLAHH